MPVAEESETPRFALMHLVLREESGGEPAILSGGRYCPVSVQAVAAGQPMKNPGDVYGRQYVMDKKVMSSRFHVSDADATMDKSETTSSFRADPTDEAYLRLIQLNGEVDDAVPTALQNAICDLVKNATKLTTSYFESILQRLGLFLGLISSELTQDLLARLNKSSVEYSATPKFNTVDDSNSAWNTEDGLFGWERDGETYSACLEDLNRRMNSDFHYDFSSADV